MAITVERVIDNRAKIGKAYAQLVQQDVLVGVPSKTTRRPGDKMTSAALLYIHENGSALANIPARPTMGPGLRKSQPQWQAYLRQAAEAAIEGDIQRMMSCLDTAGLIASAAVRDQIGSNTPPPLAESTLAARRRRGKTRTNTLVDTGEMRKAVTYVVRPR